ncbi:MAG: MBL fold metallo-hydrolase [Chloroflexi bacterium]|nr:MBL fold metallo-hydrolase [Chloroflexota bacterium]
MEVATGIHLLKVPIPGSPLGHLNAYLIRADGGGYLVDCGWAAPEAFDALESQLRDIGIGFRDLKGIILTHIHPDHYGLAGRIKELSGAEVIVHRLEEPLIESRYVHYEAILDELAPWLRQYGAPDREIMELQRAAMPVLDRVGVAEPDRLLFGGEVLTLGEFAFEVIWTPGHSPGHIVLYERSRGVLIAGDHILGTISPNVGLNPQSGPNPMRDYVDALLRVRDLEVQIVLPGHRDPFDGLRERVDRILEHHEIRNGHILAALAEGPKTGYQIAQSIQWVGGRVKFAELEPLHRRLALMETLSHAERLVSLKKLARTRTDGRVIYRLGPAAPAGNPPS